MSAIIGTPRLLFHKYKFRVEIDGIAYAGYNKCSELSIEVAKVEHFEGGTLIPRKSPGRVTVADITLEQGACFDLSHYNWMKQVANLAAGLGGRGTSGETFKRNMEIIQLDRDDSILQRWKVVGAWPMKFVAGDWDNNSDETVVTSLTLSIDYFTATIGA